MLPVQTTLRFLPSFCAASIRPLYAVDITTSPATRNCGGCAPASHHWI